MSNNSKFCWNWLLRTLDKDVFIADFWEKKPLHVSTADTAYYCDFFELANIDKLIKEKNDSPLDFSFFNQQKRTQDTKKYYDGDGNLKPASLLEEYEQKGSTLCLNYPEKRNLNIASLCSAISKLFYAEVMSSLFLGPPKSVGLNVHFDYYNAFILQLSGKKRWRLYDFAMQNPNCESDRFKLDKQYIGEPVLDIMLEQGDMLYVPRGMPHEPSCVDSHSLHLTLGVKTHNWAELLHQAIDNLRIENPLFRESLPPIEVLRKDSSKYQNLLETIVKEVAKVDFQQQIEFIEEDFYLNYSPIREVDLKLQTQALDISIDSILTWTDDLEPLLRKQNDSVEFIYQGSKLKGPLAIFNALTYITKNQTFRLGDICNDLTNNGKINLISKLVSNGCLDLRHTITN